jgi:hypothetical protein
MDFRRSGPLDERRRRVLMDEIASPADTQSADAADTGGAAKGPVRAYHEAVLAQRQPRVTDLLPVHPLWVIAALFLGVGGIAAIETIHAQAIMLALPAGGEHLAPLDVRQRGALDDWYASALLAASAALAAIIFGIRSHRVDDYRGRYRVWLWSAAALLWLSLDAATGIHDSVGLGLTLVTGRQVVSTSLAAACTLTWIAVYALVFGTLALRLLFEIWPSRLGVFAIVTSASLYVAAALLQLGIIQSPANLVEGLAQSTLTLSAHFTLLASIGFYARHVLLDANGRLKVHIDPDRRHKSKRAKLKVVAAPKPRPAAAVSTPATSEPSKFGGSSTSPSAKPTPAITKATITSPANDDDEDDDADDGEYAHLSRSERRRLKKLARREQRRAA